MSELNLKYGENQKQIPAPVSALDALKAFDRDAAKKALAAKVNGEEVDLNKELQHHRFGADRETFYFDVDWVPEYQEYWQFFKTLINLPNLGEGSTLFDVELPPKFARTRDQLMIMLLDTDEHERAAREIKRDLEKIARFHYRRSLLLIIVEIVIVGVTAGEILYPYPYAPRPVCW